MREATLLYIIKSWVYNENKECSYFNRNGWTAWASFFLKKSLILNLEFPLLPTLIASRN